MTAIAELTVNLQGPWGLPLYFPKNLLQNHFQHFPEPSGKIRAYSDRRMPTGRLMTAFSSDLRQAFPEFSEFYPSDLNPPGIRRARRSSATAIRQIPFGSRKIFFTSGSVELKRKQFHRTSRNATPATDTVRAGAPSFGRFIESQNRRNILYRRDTCGRNFNARKQSSGEQKRTVLGKTAGVKDFPGECR